MDLSLVSNKDLVEELVKRFDACVFVAYQRTGGTKKDFYVSRWTGGEANAVGLVEILKQRLINGHLMAGSDPAQSMEDPT